ncbi:MAG TPA: DUF542 domain-containing protein [Thermomicrobiaceae bacterium]|nr:DUF542 domain-containing protein [Thermomicrobiaceae bacterium]
MTGLTIERKRQIIETRLIRELVEEYPGLMPVLARYGFDLCCGGEHTLAEAAELHGLNAAEVLHEVAAAFDEVAK